MQRYGSATQPEKRMNSDSSTRGLMASSGPTFAATSRTHDSRAIADGVRGVNCATHEPVGKGAGPTMLFGRAAHKN